MSDPAARAPVHFTVIALLILLLGVSIVHVVITVRQSSTLSTSCPPVIVPRSLPCQAIPLRYVQDEPVCADKLLQAMNVTNVRIQTWNATLRTLNASRVQLGDDSGKQ
jgi:hypothetical protein